MTEAKWLACRDPERMVAFLVRKPDVRKLRLFSCANCRQIVNLAVDEGKQAIEVAERYADGKARPQELSAAREALEPYANGSSPEQFLWGVIDDIAQKAAVEAAWAVPSCKARSVEISIEASEPGSESYFGTPDQARAKTNAHALALLRDIFGNPFRPVAIDRSWRTSTVVQLAIGIYNDRAFDRMPILADALQDAGCENADILDHCRWPGPHVRGCWVVDLILGKS